LTRLMTYFRVCNAGPKSSLVDLKKLQNRARVYAPHETHFRRLYNS